jgi:hypothetical protein
MIPLALSLSMVALHRMRLSRSRARTSRVGCYACWPARCLLLRPLFLLPRLELHVGPLTIFYPSLIAMLSMIAWIVFFNRT